MKTQKAVEHTAKQSPVQATTGPWKIGNGGMVYTEDLMTCIASTFGHEGNPIEEQTANARLIATSPELLSLLKEAREYGKTEVAWKIWEKLADKAIAKAEGKGE